jgi:hypothetical protein
MVAGSQFMKQLAPLRTIKSCRFWTPQRVAGLERKSAAGDEGYDQKSGLFAVGTAASFPFEKYPRLFSAQTCSSQEPDGTE